MQEVKNFNIVVKNILKSLADFYGYDIKNNTNIIDQITATANNTVNLPESSQYAQRQTLQFLKGFSKILHEKIDKKNLKYSIFEMHKAIEDYGINPIDVISFNIKEYTCSTYPTGSDLYFPEISINDPDFIEKVDATKEMVNRWSGIKTHALYSENGIDTGINLNLTTFNSKLFAALLENSGGYRIIPYLDNIDKIFDDWLNDAIERPGVYLSTALSKLFNIPELVGNGRIPNQYGNTDCIGKFHRLLIKNVAKCTKERSDISLISDSEVFSVLRSANRTASHNISKAVNEECIDIAIESVNKDLILITSIPFKSNPSFAIKKMVNSGFSAEEINNVTSILVALHTQDLVHKYNTENEGLDFTSLINVMSVYANSIKSAHAENGLPNPEKTKIFDYFAYNVDTSLYFKKLGLLRDNVKISDGKNEIILSQYQAPSKSDLEYCSIRKRNIPNAEYFSKWIEGAVLTNDIEAISTVIDEFFSTKHEFSKHLIARKDVVAGIINCGAFDLKKILTSERRGLIAIKDLGISPKTVFNIFPSKSFKAKAAFSSLSI